LPTRKAADKRQIRGLALFDNLNTDVRRINKLHYRIKSQSDDNKWYGVIKKHGRNRGGRQQGEWICSCPDFTYRRIVCKHIFAVSYLKQFRRKITYHSVVQQSSKPVVISTSNDELIKCTKCQLTDNIVKNGRRYNKSGLIQKYLCRNCKYRFIINIGFEYAKKSPKVICAAIDLYFKGISLRKVADHTKQFYDVRIDNTSVLRWIRRFADIVSPFVNSLTPPHLSGIYHVDEMMVHVRREKMERVGHYQWLWNLMDDITRFWISSIVSQRREIADARAVFKDTKSKTTSPKAVIHDGLHSYDEAFQREYFKLKNPRVKNIRSISVRNEGLNSLVERLHGTIRDREKVMRDMQNKESAQKIIEAMRIHYNYCREHSKSGKTPAEQAGIKLDLEGNKIENLIRISSTYNTKNTNKYFMMTGCLLQAHKLVFSYLSKL
jgi:putative transposase